MRIAALYHGLLGLVFAGLPGDALRFLALDPPRHWGLWYAACAAPLIAAGLLQWARRRGDLRAGLLAAVIVGDLVGMALLVFFVVWEELPWSLMGPAAAAGLWAWLLSGVYSPQTS